MESVNVQRFRTCEGIVQVDVDSRLQFVAKVIPVSANESRIGDS